MALTASSAGVAAARPAARVIWDSVLEVPLAHPCVRGEGLIGGQVAAGQAGGARILAEQLHPAPGLLGVLAAAGGEFRVDVDRAAATSWVRDFVHPSGRPPR
jgi:hypothetical protein